MGATYETRELKTPNPENGEYRAYHFKGYTGSGPSRVWTKYVVYTEDEAKDLVKVFKALGRIPADMIPEQYRDTRTQAPQGRMAATEAAPASPPPVLLRDFAAQVFDSMTDNPNSAKVPRYRDHFEKHWAPRLGSVPVADLTTAQIQAAQDAMRKPDGSEYGSNSIRDYKISLRIVLDASIQPFNGQPPLRYNNPMVGLKPPRRNVRPRKGTVRYEDAANLLEVCAQVDERLVEPVEGSLYMGWRIEEMFGLNVGDVYLHSAEGPHVKIRRVWVPNKRPKKDRAPGEGSHVLRDFGKTPSAIREIPIPAGAVPLFERLTKDREPDEPLFVFRRLRVGGKPRRGAYSTEKHERWQYPRYHQLVGRVAERLPRIQNLSGYSTRHSYISNLLNAGVSDANVAKAVGHKNVASLDPYKDHDKRWQETVKATADKIFLPRLQVA